MLGPHCNHWISEVMWFVVWCPGLVFQDLPASQQEVLLAAAISQSSKYLYRFLFWLYSTLCPLWEYRQDSLKRFVSKRDLSSITL